MSSLQAVVFDLDDTLYPEADFVRSGFRAVARWIEERFAVPATQGEAELERLFRQEPHGRTFDLWVQAVGLPADLVPDLVSVYRDHMPVIRPHPGVVALLERLTSQYRLGLVSDGYAAVQRRKFEALALAAYFDAVVFSDDWGRDAWKPSPLPFREVVRRLGVAAGTAVYVGDNPAKDFIGARRSGLGTVRIRWAGSLHQAAVPERGHEADIDLDDLADLEAALQSLSRAPTSTAVPDARDGSPTDGGGNLMEGAI